MVRSGSYLTVQEGTKSIAGEVSQGQAPVLAPAPAPCTAGVCVRSGAKRPDSGKGLPGLESRL